MLTSVKLKNRISNLNLSSHEPVALKFIVSNIKVNGDIRGCSGFIKNIDNGVTIYVCTEPCPVIYGGTQLMYRYALHDKDYRGCINHWATEQNFADDVYKALFNVNNYNREKELY